MLIPLQRLEGKYEIVEKLREGGMGAIYKVRHRLLDELRVVKVMRPHLAEDAELKARFLTEAKAAAGLAHPNLAQIYDYTIDEDGVAYLVMEFIEGVTLGELLRAGELPPLELSLEIARQSLRAIGCLHQHGIAHRDISPDNLMLSRDVDGEPLVKLIDLGLAKLIEGDNPLTGTGVFLGKFRYAAPEMFGTVDPGAYPRSDLYSFALVLYELLTGCYPIVGQNPSSLIAGHIFRPPRDFAETDPQGRVPDNVRRAVLRALAKKPEQRFPDAEAFAAALTGEHVAAEQLSREITALFEVTARHRQSLARALVREGSTQHRLDRNFSAGEPTPAPDELIAATRQSRRDPPARAAPDERAVAAALEPIEELIADAEINRARAALDRLEERWGRHPQIVQLRSRAAEIERFANRTRVRELLRQAQEAAGRDAYESALDHLLEALELSPGDSEVRALLVTTEQAAQRRQEEIAQARALAERVAEIESLLAAGELDAAAASLRRAGETFGGQEPLPRLRAELDRRRAAAQEDEQRQSSASDALDLLQQAHELREQGRYTDALAAARRALELAPQHKLIQSLIHELERRLRSSDSTGLLAGVQAEVERDLEARSARRKGRGQERQQQADELVEEAQSLAQIEDFDVAHERLRRALELVPGHPAGLALLASVDVCRSVQEEEVREEVEVERTLGGIRTLLDAGQTTAALAELNQAAARYGPHKELRELRYEAAQVRLDPAVPDEDKTLSAVPTVGAADSASEAGATASRELEQATTEIRRLKAEGKVGRALEKLQLAVQRYGEPPALMELRYELSQALLERDAAEEESTGSQIFQELARATPPPVRAPEPDLFVTEPALTRTVPFGSEEERTPTPSPWGLPPSAPLRDEAERRPTAELAYDPPLAGDDSLGFDAPPADVPARDTPPSGQSSRTMLIAGLLVVIVFAFVGVLLSRLSNGLKRAETIAAEDVAPPVATPGVVVIDAAPWGEVGDLVVEEGPRDEPPVLSASPTPVVLELPPGRYRFTVRYPPTGESRDLTVEVRGQERSAERVVFRQVTVDEYFAKLGW